MNEEKKEALTGTGDTVTAPPPGQEVLESKLDKLDERFASLEAEFESKIKYDRHKEKIIDQLHRELQEYKDDLVKSLLRPIIMDIIQTIDTNAAHVKNLKQEKSRLDPQELLKQMEEIPAEMEEILMRQGVEPFNCEQPEFDRKRQKIVKTLNTHDQKKDKTIAQRLHNGYEWEGKVLCRERVDVYLYKPDPNQLKTNKKEKEEEEQ